MYTVKQALSLCWPMISQHWASYAVWPNQFINLANMAINMIYNYEWMHWSRQHRKDLFNMNERSQWALFTRWPVRKIDKFRWGNWKDVDKVWLDQCYCNMNLPDKELISPCCECNCTQPCSPLDLKQILPQNKLCAMEYQISGSPIAGMWWFDWRIVKVDLWDLKINDLRVTYFCWPVKMEKFSDIIPLPDSYMQVFAWIVAAHVVPMYWVARQQEDLTYYSLYRKELDYLRKHDTIVPEELVLPNNWLNETSLWWEFQTFTSVNIGNQW